MPACSDEIVSREVTTATMPSPNSGTVTPRANLVLMSEATDDVPSTVPQGTHAVRNREVGTKAPQRAKLALCSKAKGLSLSADSGAYAASVPKGVPKVLSHEARVKALSSANHLCGDEKNEASCASLPKLLAVNLEPRHYLGLITFAAM